jgi:dihydroneopterin aldolase
VVNGCTGIRFEGRQGATAADRRGLRRFEVDIEIDAPLEAAQVSDRLADTNDYAMVSDVIVGIGTGEPRPLLEFLARQMLDALAELIPGATLWIELRKLTPPSCVGTPRTRRCA